MHMFPYFVFGCCILSKRDVHKEILLPILCGIFFVTVACLEGDIRTNGMGFYWVSSYWKDMLLTRHGLLCFLGRTAMGVTGSVFLLSLFYWLTKAIPRLGVLAVFGTTTLGVYVLHERIFEYAVRYLPIFPLDHRWCWPLPLAIFFFFHCLIVLIRKWKLTRIAFFGDERWLTDKLAALQRKVVPR